MNHLSEKLIEIATDDRTGLVTAGSTITVSLAHILSLIPDNIGKLGVLVGVFFTTSLLVVNIRQEIRNTKKFNHEQLKWSSIEQNKKHESDSGNNLDLPETGLTND